MKAPFAKIKSHATISLKFFVLAFSFALNAADANGNQATAIQLISINPPNIISFDGIDDHLVINNLSNTNLFYDSSNNYQGFSYVAWVKYDAFNKWSRLMDFSSGGARNNNILIANVDTTRDLAFEVYQGNSSSGKVIARNFFNTNDHIHLAITQSSDGQVKIYKNGVLFASVGTTAKINNNINLTTNYIGRSNWANDAYFKGNISNLGIFNTALTQSQIDQIKHQGLGNYKNNTNALLLLTLEDQNNPYQNAAQSSNIDITNVNTRTLYYPDTASPTITPPANLSVEATALLTPVSLGFAIASDDIDGTLTATPDNTGPFALGIHAITWSATDSAGNTATATQQLSVVDTTAPVLSTPNNLQYTTHSTDTVSLDIGQASATDIFTTTISNDAPSTFPIGTTTVTWRAIDANGNQATAIQLISINSGNTNIISFDGIDDHLVINNLTNTNLFYDSSNNYQGFSYVAWVKYDAFNKWSRLMDFSSGGHQNNNIIIANRGTSRDLVFEVYQGHRSSGKVIVGNFFNTNDHIHLAITQSGDGQVKIYKNGVLFTSVGTTAKINNNINLTTNYIGRSNWANDAYFKGSISNLGIFNTALTQSQIDQIRRQGLGNYKNNTNALLLLTLEDQNNPYQNAAQSSNISITNVNTVVASVNFVPILSKPDNLSKTYGESVSFMLNAADGNGDTLIYTATSSNNDVIITPNGANFTITLGNVGISTIQVSVSDGSLSATQSFVLTVSPKAVTVTANAVSKVYGTDDPATYAYTVTPALISGDSFTGALARVVGESVGSYAITQNTLSINNNYSVSYVAANFIIINTGDLDGDGLNNTTEINLGLDPNQLDDLGGTTNTNKFRFKVMNRLAFGANAELDQQITSAGSVEDWIASQLANPQTTLCEKGSCAGVDDVQAKKDSYYLRHSHRIEVLPTIRPLHSAQQLQTVMGHFWDNHFNNHFAQLGWMELHQADEFYLNALGNFGTLLKANAKSWNMSVYLNGDTNVKTAPNENYAREVMELHTLGVNGGYTDEDIVQLSRIFTGWHYRALALAARYQDRKPDGSEYGRIISEFSFNPDNHDDGTEDFNGDGNPDGDKPFLINNGGRVISSRSASDGVLEGEDALSILASHAKTAAFICTKLAQKFVSDTPSQATIDVCTAIFLDNTDADNQIALVLGALFATEEFRLLADRTRKLKTPQELMLSLWRLLQMNATRYDGDSPQHALNLGWRLNFTSQPFFLKPEPTGYAEVANEWNTTDVVLGNIQQTNYVINSSNWNISLVDFFANKNLNTVPEILAFLLPMTTAGYYTATDIQFAYDILRPNHQAFVLADSELNLRKLMSVLVAQAEFNTQ